MTVTRLAEDRFRVVTGAAAVDSDLGWLELHREGDGPVEMRDVSGELAVIGIWGPRARDVLAAVTRDDVSNAALPYRRALEHRHRRRARARAADHVSSASWATSCTSRREWAVQVWDRLWRRAPRTGSAPGGYRVLESLRIEKGYRYFGTDLTAADTPFESGLGFCVALDKGEFSGRAALRRAGLRPGRRLRTLLVGGRATTCRSTAARRCAAPAPWSAACAAARYGFTLGRNVALATVPAALELGTELTVDMFGEHIPAVLERDVLYDPQGAQIRA